MLHLNYQMDHILYQILKAIFSIFLRKNIKKIDNPPIIVCVNKVENRIKLKIKTEYYLEPLMPEKMKLLASTNNKITKDKRCENAPHLEITKVVLVHCNIVNNNYHKAEEFFKHLL